MFAWNNNISYIFLCLLAVNYILLIKKTVKHSFLQAALKAAKQTKDGREEEIASLRSELEVKCANDTGS